MAEESSSYKTILFFTITFFVCTYTTQQVIACRIGSERLKLYTQNAVEDIIDARRLEKFYWSKEPFSNDVLSKFMNLNMTLVESRFSLGEPGAPMVAKNEISVSPKLIQDILVTCSSNRDRRYTLSISLEMNNPFKVIDLYVKYPTSPKDSSSDNRAELNIQVRLPQSTLLARLDQHLQYDDCLDVSSVELAPNVFYDIECLNCNEWQRRQLDNIFGKKMVQFDAEIDSLISEKFLLGLKALLSQKRLDLDLFLK